MQKYIVMKLSFVIPVYNRPDEVRELLQSLVEQESAECRVQGVGLFNVFVVEDGSTVPCEDVCKEFEDKLELHYFVKKNSGPGPSRNYGVERADGDFVIILDSDVVLPRTYIKNVLKGLEEDPECDAFGGADKAADDFTMVQKAISYSMTSFFTTGGIRGGKKKLDKFYPRSYNMGVRREAYLKIGGFSEMRYGEDIDFSYRLIEAGYQTRLFPEAWVWHKRRTDFDQFFRQVRHSGEARIDLTRRHPGTLKLVHLLPTVFTLGVVALVVLALVLRFMGSSWWMWALLPIVVYCLLIFIDSSRQNKSMQIGILSVEAAFVQLFGYGIGFLRAVVERSSKSGVRS